MHTIKVIAGARLSRGLRRPGCGRAPAGVALVATLTVISACRLPEPLSRFLQFSGGLSIASTESLP